MLCCPCFSFLSDDRFHTTVYSPSIPLLIAFSCFSNIDRASSLLRVILSDFQLDGRRLSRCLIKRWDARILPLLPPADLVPTEKLLINSFSFAVSEPTGGSHVDSLVAELK